LFVFVVRVNLHAVHVLGFVAFKFALEGGFCSLRLDFFLLLGLFEVRGGGVIEVVDEELVVLDLPGVHVDLVFGFEYLPWNIDINRVLLHSIIIGFKRPHINSIPTVLHFFLFHIIHQP